MSFIPWAGEPAASFCKISKFLAGNNVMHKIIFVGKIIC
jgi:hypothetical protein